MRAGRSVDRTGQRLFQLAIDVLGRNPHLPIAAGATKEGLRGLLIEDARVEIAVVQLTEGEQRRQRDAPVAASEGALLEKGENERGGLVGERGKRFLAESGQLRTLDGVRETELGIDHAGMCLRSAELRANGFVKIDDVLHRQVTNASVSR